MNVTLRPEAQQFIDQQIRAGHFTSPAGVLEAAIDRMMMESELDLDDDTAAAINRAEEQIDRGQGLGFDQFAAQLRQRIASR